VIAVDTNILVYAHRRDSTWHAAASAALQDLAEGRQAWAIPWPCIHEFVAIATHPRIYQPASTLAQAVDQVEAWLASPSLLLLAEAEGYWPCLRNLAEVAQISGPKVHDARIAALCELHGVRELWSVDRDFGRFPGIRLRNPLID
jgi:toxin-antitoxin system PIN domain toxin